MKRSFLYLFFVFLLVSSFIEVRVSASAVETTSFDLGLAGDYFDETALRDLIEQGYDGSNVKINGASRNINVAILDTGVKKSEFINVVGGMDESFSAEGVFTDYNGHGTEMSHIIASKYKENNDISGIATGVDIYSLKVFNKDTRDEVGGFERLLEFAIESRNNVNTQDDIDIINMSVSLVETDEMSKMLEMAYDAGILLVASAGNGGNLLVDGMYPMDEVRFPANHPDVIAVSNINTYGSNFEFNPNSHYGPEVEIGAPGTNIPFYGPLYNPDAGLWENKFKPSTGTSPAAAIVTGTLALLKSKYPDKSNIELRNYLQLMARPTVGYNSEWDMETEGKNDKFGYGFLQAAFGKKVSPYVQSFSKSIPVVFDIPMRSGLDGIGANYVNLPSGNYKVVREHLDWVEIEYYDKNSMTNSYRWVRKNGSYKEAFSVTLNEAVTKIYEEIDGTLSVGTLNPQTVSAIFKDGDWFLINTWLGYKWIKPTNYEIGDFQMSLNQRTPFYNEKIGENQVSTLTPQIVTVFKRSGDWFQINTWLGAKWIKPSNYSLDKFPITIFDNEGIYYEANLNNPYQTKRMIPHSFYIDKKVGEWVRAWQSDENGNEIWLKPSNFYIGEFSIKITKQEILYNEEPYDELNRVASGGSVSPQTLTAIKMKTLNGKRSYLVKTWLGNKWIEPTEGSYGIFQN